MKVLVIDDDPNAQRILKLLLQRAGYEPLACETTEQGLVIAQGDQEPRVIICDWRANGIDGLAFCRQLRASKARFRPFVYIISSRFSKEEIAQALDAGADDYISKPFNLVELQARLRAATRQIEYQSDLLKQVEDASGIADRNQLLGEMLTQKNSAKIPNIIQSAAAAVTMVKQSTQPRKTGDFTQYEIRFMCSAALLEMKLVLEDTKPRLVPPNLRAAEFCAWAPLLLPGQQLWIDLFLSGTVSDGAMLFERSLHRKPSGYKETLTFLAELVRIMAHGFLRTLQMQDPGSTLPTPTRAVQPILSSGMPMLPAGSKSHDLVIDGRSFALTQVSHECPRLELEPGSLRELDYLGEALPPAHITEIPLFKKGTLMGRRFVEKLKEQSELTHFDYSAIVHRPSPFARHFLSMRGEGRLLD